jgi:hypothetical protein
MCFDYFPLIIHAELFAAVSFFTTSGAIFQFQHVAQFRSIWAAKNPPSGRTVD